jgi:phage terminase large subunit-like protein
VPRRRDDGPPPCDAAALARFQSAALGPVCRKSGEHQCLTRSRHAVLFFEAALCHTKGRWSRQPFTLATWQRRDIIQPLFGRVRWDAEAAQYVRQYSMAWMEVARKNGKSELLAGCALYLLSQDGEEGAEVYGAAADRDQARVVWDVAARMVQLSPVLSKRLRVRVHERRIIDERSGSFYTVISRDAAGNLGTNPHGIIFDEVLAQKDGSLWDAMRTAMGARTQPLMLAATTAGHDATSFAATEHAECVKIAEEPGRAPHRFTYIRGLAQDADPWDERGWKDANPALGDFLSLTALRQEAAEARNDPTKENTFRQFRLNQWVSQASRWMPMEAWDACSGEPWLKPDWRVKELHGREVWAGLDLSARHDLTSLAVVIPDGPDPAHILWRHWLPEDALPLLDEATSGQASAWARAGWLTVQPGAVIDYQDLCEQVAAELKPYRLREIAYDKWSGEYVRQSLERLMGRVPMIACEPTYTGMTPPLNELMALVKTHGIAHHGNPVARFCMDAAEVMRSTMDPNLIRVVKPSRSTGEKRIDAVVTAALGAGGWRIRGQQPARKRTGHGF